MTVTRARKPKATAKKAMFTKKGSGVTRAIATKNKQLRAPKRKLKN